MPLQLMQLELIEYITIGQRGKGDKFMSAIEYTHTHVRR